ncbi:MAG TPA: response regulator transcription factor [Leptospiraceae bacterium]|nr:response regulator transcription factor [Leptospiraceae bacterium]HNB97997.1 response regulator transcription factor [Leptospiraceae bacterium]HNE07772.1 response regulator transcription factor [Leptospiraceae bacterium]HNG98865.1 response regulator transcription factor [Leptospiraceae bacterium]HNI90474.1 response regulator transcription factor [Leptospiraceae bacterium]
MGKSILNVTDSLKTNIVYGLVENDRLFSSTLAGTLRLRKETKMVYEFSSGEEAVRSNTLSSINFLIVDYRLDGMDGISFLAKPEIKKLKIPKLILTGFNAEEKIFEALKHGVTGYMFKEDFSSLGSILEILLAGGAFITPSIAARVCQFFEEKNESNSAQLTDRESQILNELCNGNSPKEIAESLKIQMSTVRYHIKNIYSKLEVNNQLQLVAKVINKE